MKKTMTTIALSTALILPTLATPTFADEAKRKELASQMVQSMNMVEQVKRTLPMMQQQVLMTMARKYPGVGDDTLRAIKTLSDEFTLTMVTSAQPALTKIILDNFSEEELSDILAFYKSKSGKALLEKRPQMSQAMMQWTNTSMMKAMSDMDEKVVKLLEAEKRETEDKK